MAPDPVCPIRGDFNAGPVSLKIWFSSSLPGARYVALDDARSDGFFFSAFLVGMGVASDSGTFTLGSGLAFGGGRGTVVLLSLASGLTSPGRDGRGMLLTTLTPTDPPPGFGLPQLFGLFDFNPEKISSTATPPWTAMEANQCFPSDSR